MATDYILNAFRFANEYAPETLELYYNDYNDCASGKVTAIENLLKSVKKHESDAVLPTRITGFGMQGHHDSDSPSKQQIFETIQRYGAIVDKVQVTELDVKTTNGYDGSEQAKEREYTKMGHRYKDIYNAYVEADKIGNDSNKFDVNGFTVWGSIDSISWLNDSNNAGGGSNGSQKQCPLLFDGNYQAKPAFWGIVDPDVLDPYIHSVDVIESNDGSLENGVQYDIPSECGIGAYFIPVWNADAVTFTVKTTPADSVTLYYELADGTVSENTVSGNDLTKAELAIEAGDQEFKVLDQVKFDIVVKKGDEKVAFNDTKFTQEESSKFFAEATCKPFATIQRGTAIVDGKDSGVWATATEIPLTVVIDAPLASGTAKMLWDDDNLYLYMTVKDPYYDMTNTADHEKDSVEVFIDEKNDKSGAYGTDDKQYRVNLENEQTFNNCTKDTIRSRVTKTNDGYIVEAAFAWTDIEPAADDKIGLDLQINDAKDGKRIGHLNWFDIVGNGWQNTALFGTAKLGAETIAVSDEDATDKAVAQAVATIINALDGKVEYTAACKAKIDAARSAYESLEDYQQYYYFPKASLDKLEEIEKKYAQFVADEAEEVIDAIGDIDDLAYDEESKAKIDAAREAFDALTEIEQSCVDPAKASALRAAEEKYASFVAGDAAEVIDAIGEVAYNDASKAKIKAAREAYDALTELEQSFIDDETYAKLVNAEEAYEAAKEEAEKKAAEEAAKAEAAKKAAEEAAKAEAAKKAAEEAAKAEAAKKAAEEAAKKAAEEEAAKKAAQEAAKNGVTNNNGKAEKGETKITSEGTYTATSGTEAIFTKAADTKLTKIVVPDTVEIDKTNVKVTAVAANAYKGNTSAKSITIGKNVKKIGKNAFNNCKKAKKIYIHAKSLKKIDKTAFKGCPNKKTTKVYIYAKNKTVYNKIVKMVKKAGLSKATFKFKKEK